MSFREVILDRWSALSHKMPMSDTAVDKQRAAIDGWQPSPWTGEEHRRRLTAYMLLQAYVSNVSRGFLNTTDEADRSERREYGDPELLVEEIRDHLLGDTQEIMVPGAERYDPTLDEAPAPGDTVAAETAVENAAARRLFDAQDFMRTWGDRVHLPLRLTDCETKAVSLGDGVYLMSWDDRKGYPVPSVMDPGFYFPVLPDTLDEYDFPERVHFAWEIPADQYPDRKARVRRITYELSRLRFQVDEAALAAATSAEDVEAATKILPDNTTTRRVTEPDGFSYDEVVREYAWNDEPSPWTCTMTDATWIVDDLKDAHKVDAFSLDNASVKVNDDGEEIRGYDLGIDFLPVVHVPNTTPGGDHYGESSLAKVLQLLDDIQNADTDASAAAATTGSPIIAVKGSAATGDNPLTGQRGTSTEVRPGAVWKTGVDGGMDVLDTSPNLTATRAYVEHLLGRLSVNVRLPAAVLGRVSPADVPSGFAMELSFGPMVSMIRQMRAVRAVKYGLLLKFAWRLYQANGALPEGLQGEVGSPPLKLALGSFLPQDRAAVMKLVVAGVEARVLSLETGVRMLVEVGFPIDDAATEVKAIESRMFAEANLLADATGDGAAVREFLGLPEVTAVPTVPLIGA